MNGRFTPMACTLACSDAVQKKHQGIIFSLQDRELPPDHRRIRSSRSSRVAHPNRSWIRGSPCGLAVGPNSHPTRMCQFGMSSESIGDPFPYERIIRIISKLFKTRCTLAYFKLMTKIIFKADYTFNSQVAVTCANFQ